MLPLHDVALDDVERPCRASCENLSYPFAEHLQLYNKMVIALISVKSAPCWDIYRRSQARVLRYLNSGQYSPISVQ